MDKELLDAEAAMRKRLLQEEAKRVKQDPPEESLVQMSSFAKPEAIIEDKLKKAR